MIEEFKTLSRLGKCYLFVENVVGVGLTPDANAQMTQRLSAGVREILLEGDLIIGTSDKAKLEEIATQVETSIYKENTAIVNNYRMWVLNYGLVLLCSIFDDFLYELVREITTTHPELCFWMSQDEILGSFMNKNMKEKIGVIVNRLKIKEHELFDLTSFTDEVQKKFNGINFSTLIQISKKRDRAAHTDSYVLRDLDELEYIKDLFDKLVLNLSVIARRKWGAKSALIESYKAIMAREKTAP